MKKTKSKKSLKAKVAPVIQNKVAPVLKKAEKKVNIPNLLTMVRMWAIPLIVLTFFFKKMSLEGSVMWAWVGVVLFAIAGITDYLDGYLARHWNQLSRFGRVLDPIADKLLVGSILVMLAWEGRLQGIMVIPAVIILSREILVSGLREFLAEIKVGCPVTRLAKWKTACQMMALPMLMICDEAGVANGFFTFLGTIFFWGAAILTIMTGYDYWKSGRKYMND
jgi:cardiolipin synthase